MPKAQTDMIRGTLDMLILRVVSLEPMHGWGISERIQQMSDDALQVTSCWGPSECTASSRIPCSGVARSSAFAWHWAPNRACCSPP